MNVQKYLVGMAQILVEGGRPEANLARAVAAVAEAKARGCRLVVLPECLDLGWCDPSTTAQAQPIPGTHADRLNAAARDNGIFVVAGLVERSGERFFNAAILIGPGGELLLHHRKINELDIALDLYSVGDRLAVAQTPLGTLAINICADNFPETLCIGETLARMGAQVILSPCAWAVDADYDHVREPYGDLWRGSYGALARRHDLTIIGVSNVGWVAGGAWKGKKVIGCSLAVGPGGAVLAEGPYGENAAGLICVEVEPRPRGQRHVGRGRFASAKE